ncbi:MAG: tannase/feruloyl esterase family alpha/beta hydrolase [Lautropia sp.]
MQALGSRPGTFAMGAIGTVAAIAACLTFGARAEAASAEASKSPTDCAQLQRLALPATRIVSTAHVAEGEARAGKQRLPSHCVLSGVFGERTGVDGARYATHFELRLPDAWNGRFQFMGGGGTDGSVKPAYGFDRNGSKPALADGYAVVSSDFGHQASDPRDASFGLDPEARIDWGYRAIEAVTTRAKSVIGTYYGRAPSRSYFAGCSGGGRQALVASQRFADAFDGIVAGAPILEQHVAQIGSMQILQAFTAIAPRDDAGRPILSRAFSDADLSLLATDVAKRCDGLDGLVDGIVDDYRACRYSPRALQCEGEKTASCLAAPQVQALTSVLAGPTDSRGKRLYEPYPIDIAVGQWRGAMLGTSNTPTPNARRATNTSIRFVFMTPPAPDFDYLAFDFDRDPPRLAASAPVTASNGTDYTGFKARGAKAIVYMGIGDALLNANGTLRWYERLAEANGGLAATQAFARYFHVPGMGHCGGGPSLDQFDPFGALVAWVENGQAPDALMASGRAFPGRTRPLCAYPKQTRHVGAGSIDDAANFRCE